jgi:hypothetical protein
MKNPININHTETETLLREAGFTFTAVDRCPHPGCLVCGPLPQPKAA